MEAHQEGRGIIFMEEMKHHIKGKRTKGRRPSSALTLTLSSTTSSSSSLGSENGGLANHSGFYQMPSTSNIEFTNILQDNDNENDQDMATCLMLLSHGHRVLTPSPLKMVVPRSYVYECKTCDRGFASFQALGGHRASHNKPHKDIHELTKNRTSFSISPNRTLSCNPSGSTKRSKVHECAICGSDFTSGQALGGHMRRHRSMTMTTTTIAASSNSSYGCHGSKKHKTILPLDLNLPAPTEDDHKETTNAFEAINQIIVFSTPSVVDCHF